MTRRRTKMLTDQKAKKRQEQIDSDLKQYMTTESENEQNEFD